MPEAIDHQRELADRAKRQKEFDSIVDAAVKRVIRSVDKREAGLSEPSFNGAMGIHPKWLGVWYIFVTDADLEAARQNGLTQQLIEKTRAELQRGGYPIEELRPVFVTFGTEEDIHRSAGGNRWHYFR